MSARSPHQRAEGYAFFSATAAMISAGDRATKISAALEAFQHDDAVRIAVIRGAGGKAFASGADISEFDQHRANAAQRKEYTAAGALGHEWLRRFDKPLLALIEGFCIGGGLVLALCADVRFATPASRFAIPAARLGLGYEYSGVAALARLIGPSATRDLLFSARLVEADEALRLGLIHSSSPATRSRPGCVATPRRSQRTRR